jgi:uncharacterized membrane protein YdfJ with MMPL/SSD domain
VLAIASTTDQVRSLGFGVAAGILMDTFLIRTLLIPALVVLLGRWNWWPSRLAHGANSRRYSSANAEQTSGETAITIDGSRIPG